MYNSTATEPPSWTTSSANGSSFNSSNAGSDTMAIGLRIAMGVPMLLGMLPGIFGNLLVILAITTTRLNHHIINLLVLSLALSDILISVFPLPVLGAYFVFYWPQWMLSSAWCKASIYVVNICAVVSILTMATIAVDRYFAIQRNVTLLTRRKCKILLLVIWLISAAIAMSNILNGGTFEERLEHGTYSVCNRITGKFIQDKSIKTSLILKLAVGLPFVIGLILIYMRLSYGVWQQRHVPTDEDRRSKSVRRQRGTKNKALQMMFAIVIAFAVCWIPYYIVTFMRVVKLSANPDMEPGFVLFSYVLVMLNSTVNPLLYALLSKSFRNAYISVLTGKKERQIRTFTFRTSELRDRSMKL